MKTPSRSAATIMAVFVCASFAALFMVVFDDLFGAGVGIAIGAGVSVALFSPSRSTCTKKSTPSHD
jgi:uncharacterized membrane protein YgaE (UPF0421/DUF939 family)